MVFSKAAAAAVRHLATVTIVELKGPCFQSRPRLPHSALLYRTLLPNMSLMAGMRGGSTRFKVGAVGVEADRTAYELLKLEPGLDFASVSASIPIDDLAPSERPFAAIFIIQPYHVLRAK